MGYDPEKHHRRSIRLRGWDYTQPGAYFVTICIHNGECLFEDPVLRRVVEMVWQRIPRRFPRVRLDEFVVMPNHVHGIIWITDSDVGAAWCPVHWGRSSATSNRLRHDALTTSAKPGAPPVWQRNYYEHIVHNENELRRIKEYIRLNPLK